MALKLTNNASSTLAAPLDDSGVILAVQTGDAGKFPVLEEGDWFPLTVVDAEGNMEIMRVTARSAANMTVERAQEGTAARQWSPGARAAVRLTAAAAQLLLELPTETHMLLGDGDTFRSAEPSEVREALDVYSKSQIDEHLDQRPAFIARKTTTQPISTTGYHLITFPNVQLNIGEYFQAGQSRFVPPAGLYRLSAKILISGSSGLFIRKNGQLHASLGSGGAPIGSALVQANGTDYFDFAVEVGSVPTNISANAWYTYCCGERV